MTDDDKTLVERLREAAGLAYCHFGNEHKEMDADLMEAVVFEVAQVCHADRGRIEVMKADLAKMTRRRDEWRKKAEGYDAVRKALREKVGAPWPPNLSRALWAGIAADEKKRADEAEERVEALEAEADAWNRKAVAAMEERNAALAQVAAAYEGAACVLLCVLNKTTPDSVWHAEDLSLIAQKIRRMAPDAARAAYDVALRKARAEGMREAAGTVASKAQRREYADEFLGTIIGRSLIEPGEVSNAILARADQIEQGEDHD